MTLSIYGAFVLASVLLAFAPGPDNMFVLVQSAVHGVRKGLFTVAGLSVGVALQTVAAALGVAAAVAASPSLFWAIRILGALYLTYLAVMSWTHPTAGSASATKETADSVLFRRGILMNVTNPKVQIFFLAFFPQFVTRGASSLQTACEMTVLGVTFMIVTLLVFSLIAFCAGSVAEKLRTPRVQFYLNRTAAVIFACLAAGTLLS